MAGFMLFSLNAYSLDKPHKKAQSAKTEQPKKKGRASKRKPKKSVSKKMTHKSGPKRHGSKAGN